jgi:hypothetical protein
MSNPLMHDYDQVRVLLNESVIDPLSSEVIEPDLSFSFGMLSSALPVMFFYSSSELDERTEKACEEAGVLTCGAVGSKIPLLTPEMLAVLTGRGQSDGQTPRPAPFDKLGCYIHEAVDPTARDEVANLRGLTDLDQTVIVGCSVSPRHGRAVANEMRIASALLVGPTQATTFKDIDTLGMATPRVSLTQELARATDVPVFVTAGSASETCKALVAGADAVVINIGGPFGPDEDVKFVVDAVAQSLKENIERLCKLAGAKKPSDLQFRCRLTPAR